MPGRLRVTQVKSTISHIERNRATARALGPAGRIGDTVEVPDSPATRGMVRQIRFLVTVEGFPETTPEKRSDEAPRSPPAAGAHTKKTRVGRGIAAGKGNIAGRGTKGQKSRAGSSIPPWFEGGQTPLHIRIPKLRGFKNINRIEYEVVNVGRISAAAETGRLPEGEKGAPIAVTQELLRVAGLVRSLDKPLKILGGGDVGHPLFVIADAFTKSAREKIEAAGGSVQLLEVPSSPLAALGVGDAAAEEPAAPKKQAAVARPAKAAKPATADAPSADGSAAGANSPTADGSAAGTELPTADGSAAGADFSTADGSAAGADSPTADG